MARDADDHNDLNDLFQLLTHARDMRPAMARAQILQQLQLGRLEVDLHIRGCTRMIHPFQQATDEERAAGVPIGATDGVIVDGYHLYKTAPPEGIVEPIPFDAWGRLFHLAVEGERLVVEPNCAVDYPWDACKCVVSNWPVVVELWPSPKSKKRRWSVRRQMLNAIVRRIYGEEGPGDDIDIPVVQRQVENEWAAECRTWHVDPKKTLPPDWEMVATHLGRRRR